MNICNKINQRIFIQVPNKNNFAFINIYKHYFIRKIYVLIDQTVNFF